MLCLWKMISFARSLDWLTLPGTGYFEGTDCGAWALWPPTTISPKRIVSTWHVILSEKDASSHCYHKIIPLAVTFLAIGAGPTTPSRWRRVVGKIENGELFTGILTFMIVGLRMKIPFVVRAVPENKITGIWDRNLIDEVLNSLHDVGFNVRAVISDNHPTNVAAFSSLLSDYGIDLGTQAFIRPSYGRKIYMLYDTIHLIKIWETICCMINALSFQIFILENLKMKFALRVGKLNGKICTTFSSGTSFSKLISRKLPS